MSDTYGTELAASREQVASVISGVVDGLVSGSVRVGHGEDAVAVEPPDEVELGIELEVERDETSLEIEVEWPTADGESGTVPLEEPPEAETGVAPRANAMTESESDETAEPVVPVGAADASQSLARFEVFSDKGDEWRWRLRHRNGNVIASSGEGYTRKHNAWKGLRSVMKNAPEAEVTEERSG